MTATVQSIHLYPVKSLAGLAVSSSEVEPWGLRHDRRWLLLDPDGTPLTARECREMLGIRASFREGGGVTLVDEGGEAIDVDLPVDRVFVETSVSRLDGIWLADGHVHEWLSQRLPRPVRLGWFDDPRRRPVSPRHGGLDGEPLSLADAGPLLLTSETSLKQLNAWIAESQNADPPAGPVVMTRFRPNVVVEGIEEPFLEDGWSHVRIADVSFRVAERCDRCMMTMIDPDTRAMGKEPLRTLARHRRHEGKVWFGVRLIPQSIGQIAVGDSVSGL